MNHYDLNDYDLYLHNLYRNELLNNIDDYLHRNLHNILKHDCYVALQQLTFVLKNILNYED